MLASRLTGLEEKTLFASQRSRFRMIWNVLAGFLMRYYNDGSSYTGCLRNGLRHGPGVRGPVSSLEIKREVFRSQTEIYEGEWLEDAQHGAGKQIWNDGLGSLRLSNGFDECARRVYEGQYARGHFNGQGRMVWKTPKGT